LLTSLVDIKRRLLRNEDSDHTNGRTYGAAHLTYRVTQVFVNEGDIVEAGAPLFESRVDVETEGG